MGSNPMMTIAKLTNIKNTTYNEKTKVQSTVSKLLVKGVAHSSIDI